MSEEAAADPTVKRAATHQPPPELAEGVELTARWEPAGLQPDAVEVAIDRDLDVGLDGCLGDVEDLGREIEAHAATAEVRVGGATNRIGLARGAGVDLGTEGLIEAH